MLRKLMMTSAVAGWTAVALAQPDLPLATARHEDIRFESAGSLAQSEDGRTLKLAGPVRLSGQFEFPIGDGPFPLVILAHGCDGIGPTETGWAGVLREWGYATFLLDSFAERGLDSLCVSTAALAPSQRIPDAYGALRALAKHPNVDRKRVALMGFSHGGMLTLGASTAWAKQTFAPAGQPAFRAFFPFYPHCGVDYPERKRISAPVRLHTGALDDWTPAEPCAQMVKAWQAAGQNADITIYPGAYHSFDYPELPQMTLPDAGNIAACRFRIPSILGPLPTREQWAGCVRKGATIGGNREAVAKAEETLKRQLAELLK